MNVLSKKTFFQVVSVVVIWRIVLFVISILAPHLFLYDPSFPYYEFMLPASHLPQWLYSWGNFDGVHYLTISEKGYFGIGLVQAFFPVYPLLIRFLTILIGHRLVAGLIISNLAFLIATVLFCILIHEKCSKKLAWQSLFFFILFPTSFFGVALYSESLFLCFVFASFLCAERKQWFWAGCLAGFASATRVIGIFLIPALLIELLYSNYPKEIDLFLKLVKNGTLIQECNRQPLFKHINVQKQYWKILSILIGCMGLLFYMIYLKIVFHDPLYFSHVQAQFGSGRQDRIVLLPQVLWRGVKIIMTVPIGLRWWSYFQELFFTITALALLFCGLFKRFKVPFSWLFFAGMAILLPTMTGTLSSMPRYVLVAFPIFVILAKLCTNRYIRIIVLSIFAVALLINTALFIQGYWVA